MRSDELLQETLETTGLPVKQYEYKGTKSEYIVFNEEDERGTAYSDDRPAEVAIWWQVHLFMPRYSDYRSMKRTIMKALIDAGFLLQEITTLFEQETETIHVAISCGTTEEMEE
ncbi:MAG: hypothetical protein Q4B70_01000 [Lachnospiraceae bacterium]|nr:hypothetical protein [Lachnospiraceae bacterium]